MVKDKKIIPRKPEADKNRGNPGGLSNKTMEWVEKEAEGRQVYVADIIREAVEWYQAAIERQRGDEAVGLFDEIRKPIENTKPNKK